MLPGELSLLTCSPQYAYGAKGIPPMIPPSATLQFEVELLSIQAPSYRHPAHPASPPEHAGSTMLHPDPILPCTRPLAFVGPHRRVGHARRVQRKYATHARRHLKRVRAQDGREGGPKGGFGRQAAALATPLLPVSFRSPCPARPNVQGLLLPSPTSGPCPTPPSHPHPIHPSLRTRVDTIVCSRGVVRWAKAPPIPHLTPGPV